MAQSLPLFRDAEQRFRELEKALPNDPLVLYMLAWTGYNAFAPASRLAKDDDAAHFIGLAQSTIDRLMAIETQDLGLVTMSSGIREGRAQFLRDLGRFDEAIATQREVIAGPEKLLANKRLANSLGTRGYVGRACGKERVCTAV